VTGRANRCHHAKRSDSLLLKNVSTTKPWCSPDQPTVSSENGKNAANQPDHSHHCIPSRARAVTPTKVGVISATLYKNILFVLRGKHTQHLAYKHLSVDAVYEINIPRSFETRVSQLKIWHFWILGIERKFADALFNMYNVITQFGKLAAGEQLCRRYTHRKLCRLKTFKSLSWKKNHTFWVVTLLLWRCCCDAVVTLLLWRCCCDAVVVTLLLWRCCCDAVVVTLLLWRCCRKWTICNFFCKAQISPINFI